VPLPARLLRPLTHPDNKGLADLNRREILYLAPLVLLCFWIGLYPRPFFRVLENPVQYVMDKVNGAGATALASAPAAAPVQTVAAGE